MLTLVLGSSEGCVPDSLEALSRVPSFESGFVCDRSTYGVSAVMSNVPHLLTTPTAGGLSHLTKKEVGLKHTRHGLDTTLEIEQSLLLL